jgi:hypothetical protein
VHRAVPTEDEKRAAYRALEDRILYGEGRASAEQRARAFGNAGLPQPLDGLLGKVAARPAQVARSAFTGAAGASTGPVPGGSCPKPPAGTGISLVNVPAGLMAGLPAIRP